MTPRCLIAVLAIASWMFAACEATSQEKPEVSATALQKSLNDVKALFGDKYAAARAIRSRNQRRTALVSLADELLEMAETTAEPADRYALFQVARQIAVQAPDAQRAMAAIDKAAGSFRLNGSALKKAALAKICDSLTEPAEYRAVVPHILRALEQSVQQDRYELAQDLASQARSAAAQSRDRQLSEDTAARVAEIEQVIKAYAEYQKALTVLKETPDDANANLIAGRFLCISKGDWKNGASYLALSGDPELRKIALAELVAVANPVGAGEWVTLADDWWNVAERNDGSDAAAFMNRARYWYQRALPQLPKGGLSFRRVQVRLNQAAAARPAAPGNPAPKPASLPKLARQFIGMYMLVATARRSGNTNKSIWEFQESGKVLENGTVCGHWSATDFNRIQIAFTDAALDPVYLKLPGAQQPIQSSRNFDGDSWRWVLTRLQYRSWRHTTVTRGSPNEGGPETKTIRMYSNGRVDNPFGTATWTIFAGRKLTINWGDSVQTVATLAPDGKSYQGRTSGLVNGYGRYSYATVTGTLLPDGN